VAGTLSETTDLYLLGDMTADGRECSGYVALACRLVARLQTPTGFFPWWKTFGLNIRKYSLSKTPTWQMAHEIDAELKKDEQVKDVVVIPTLSDQGRAVRFTIQVQAEVGVFTFTMNVTDAAATLINLQKNAG
jgi:hypothetical protein